jgi:hypothetical protein
MDNFFLEKSFTPITEDCFSLFKDYEQTSNLQERTAIILITWSVGFYRGFYKILNGWLCCAFFHKDGSPWFIIAQPEQENYASDAALKQIIDSLYVLSQEGAFPVLSIGNVDDLFLAKYLPVKGYTVKTTCTEARGEYRYLRENVLKLSGKSNHKKHSVVKQFSRDSTISLNEITKENLGLCVEIENNWCAQRKCDVCSAFMGCEKEALKIMLSLYDMRIHRGIYIYHDKTPVGFLIWEKRGDTAFLYYGKSTERDFFMYIIYTAVKDFIKDAKYININDDMGNPGLRLFKKLLGKHDLLMKHDCFFSPQAEGDSSH